MGILNITPDSFFGPSRTTADDVLRRVGRMAEEGAAIVDLGAVSTRPGAPEVSEDEEWARLEPALRLLAPEEARCGLEISIDTFRSGIVRKACGLLGRFWVNDISAGEDDPEMLATVGALGLPYIAMHKRGNPRTMDGLTDYEDGIIPELLGYFNTFSLKAEEAGITEWMADPGLGFAKTHSQNWEILERLGELSADHRRRGQAFHRRGQPQGAPAGSPRRRRNAQGARRSRHPHIASGGRFPYRCSIVFLSGRMIQAMR